MKRHSGLKWLLRGVLSLAVCLSISLCAGAESAQVEELLVRARVKPVIGSGTFTQGEDVTFHRWVLPAYIVDRYADSAYAVDPGESHELVKNVKMALYSDTGYSTNNGRFRNNEFVTYTQVRPPLLDMGKQEYSDVVYYFDDHLATLLETIYLFCGLEDKEPCLDELTCYLLDRLHRLPEDFLHDIERVYKYKLTVNGLEGTVNLDGSVDDLYYFAQTDSDWAAIEFEFDGNGDTIKDRGCGTACASMVFSTYHKVEISPRWTAHYALAGDWPVSYGLPNEYFEGIANEYRYLETERYGTVLESPEIIVKQNLDMDQLAQWIGEDGYLAIIHVVAGAFTSHEHYMVLYDYEIIDGKGYYLVADPYVLPSRYSSRDQMLAVDSTNEGLIYATADVLYRDCKSVILFEKDRNAFPLFSKCESPEYFPVPEA